MKANELRIGNWVLFGGEPDTVNGNTISYLEGDEIIDEILINPIQLTEEWLVKFGVECVSGWIYRNKSLRIEYNLETFDILIITENHSHIWHNIKYVHSLQNLYFALTGKEIKTKAQ